MLLSQDFNHHDKALIIWLIAELCKSTEHGFWVDLRSVMALLGFMLYRHMDIDDLPVLYQSKFGACADSVHSVHIEIVLGFGVDKTLAYLNQHKDNHPNYTTMINTITHYDENKTAPFRTYDDYCQFFKECRFNMCQEEIVTDCGL